MRAVRSAPPGVSVVEVDEPDGPGEMIAIRSASICASDLMYIGYGSRFLLGHELAGVTEDGSAVAIEAIFGCDECEHCLAGDYNHCATVGTSALGIMADGGMSEWFRAPARSLKALPAGLDAGSACLVEPTAVAWHAARLAGAGPGRRVAVVGGGAIGLMAVAAAKTMGADEVSLEARYPHQIALGEHLGATAPSGNYDVVIEAAGSESGLYRSVELARPGGTMGVLGVFGPEVSWPQQQCFTKELRTVPSLGYCRHGATTDFDEAAAMLAADPGFVDALITHRFPIEDAEEAFRVASDKSTGALRVIIEP
ncbi:MAG: Alcohol dehydrogenase zinc-binding domain protein [Actinomycetia bacterium]|nr:Alcohol dehydrogenase zinc-binding domain protein [Actinomycetes bacterium]